MCRNEEQKVERANESKEAPVAHAASKLGASSNNLIAYSSATRGNEPFALILGDPWYLRKNPKASTHMSQCLRKLCKGSRRCDAIAQFPKQSSHPTKLVVVEPTVPIAQQLNRFDWQMLPDYPPDRT